MFCMYCGKAVSEDVVFCPYCGKKLNYNDGLEEEIENVIDESPATLGNTVDIIHELDETINRIKQERNTQERYTNVDRSSYKVKTNYVSDYPKSSISWRALKPIIGIIFLIIIIAAGLSDGLNSGATSTIEEGMEPLSLPANGYVFEGSNMERNSELTIKCQSDSNCFIKLKNPDGKTVFSFFVRSGQTCKVKVPGQRLQVFFASGNDWYGIDKAFGKNTTYAKDDEILDFSSYTYTYTLYPVTNGNFTETPISPDEF